MTNRERPVSGWRYASGVVLGLIAAGTFALAATAVLQHLFLTGPGAYRYSVEMWRTLTEAAFLVGAVWVPVGVFVQWRPLWPRLATRRAVLLLVVPTLLWLVAAWGFNFHLRLRIEMWWMLEDLP